MQWIKTDGTIEEITLVDRDGDGDRLKQLQEAVNGYIELLYINPKKNEVMVVNEEGLLRRLPVNRRASKLAGQTIRGNVLFGKATEIH